MQRREGRSLARQLVHSYSYDNVGNVATLTNNQSGVTQSFAYDARDRLTRWSEGASSQSYSYDLLGNLTSKSDIGSYSYGPQSASCSAGALDKAHAVVRAGTASYCYDHNGNLISGDGRSYAWDRENRITNVTSAGVSESYNYDADGERVSTTRSGSTTVYLEGLWEEVIGGATKVAYSFNGAVVALRDTSTNVVTYLHSDHLGSVSVATNSSGAVVSRQEFDPWGKVRTGAISQTSLNYTGQRLDASGLLYYHARYYDPVLGRFVSADSVVPGTTALSIGADKPSNGPANPQDLNRYSYVTNNPLNRADPTGHCGTTGLKATAISVMSGECTSRALEMYNKARTTEGKVVSGAVAVASAIGAVAGYAGGALLAVAGGEAIAGAVAGGGTAATASDTGGAVATAACADGDCGNEISEVATLSGHLGEDAAVVKAREWVQPIKGFWDFIAHGTPDSLLVKSESGKTYFNAREIADYIRTQTDWDGGPIRLLACKAGACPIGFAHQLAKILNVTVQAATDDVMIYPSGKIAVDNGGKFVNYSP